MRFFILIWAFEAIYLIFGVYFCIFEGNVPIFKVFFLIFVEFFIKLRGFSSILELEETKIQIKKLREKTRKFLEKRIQLKGFTL
jgi:hypothetical protein